ncbi:alpha/beta hydrolase [Falsibacillus pallidus]|uniref:Carboxylesterase n=1 Tax=Falsibacillus pallidus TaxID=493781 RepID=A0A370GTQ5_9BACI|nr:alpha/beta fold hydrolase [Falsibacillus pallidus]RDI45924.1 carboxylesterase [Falsibacillus pallidus]
MIQVTYPIIEGAEEFFFRGSETGILICHGFVGTPQSVRQIAEKIHKSTGCTIFAPRLKGHGTCETDLSLCSHQDWFENLVQSYHHLKKYCSRIYVIGQSMGGTLALKLASSGYDIAGIITINAAVQIPGYDCYREAGCSGFIQEGSPDINQPIEDEITYSRVPLSAVQELLQLIDSTKERLRKVICPALLIKSIHDHVVPHEATDLIYHSISSLNKSIITLEKSFHVATMDCELKKIIASIKRFISDTEKNLSIERIS